MQTDKEELEKIGLIQDIYAAFNDSLDMLYEIETVIEDHVRRMEESPDLDLNKMAWWVRKYILSALAITVDSPPVTLQDKMNAFIENIEKYGDENGFSADETTSLELEAMIEEEQENKLLEQAQGVIV